MPLLDDKQREGNVFWRASEVLEKHSICLFGTDDFTRDVAVRMSNLARATNPFSKILSSNAFSVAPDKNTMLLHIILPEESDVEGIEVPRVMYTDYENANVDNDMDSEEKTSGVSVVDDFDVSEAFVKRLISGLSASKKLSPARMTIELPGKT